MFQVLYATELHHEVAGDLWQYDGIMIVVEAPIQTVVQSLDQHRMCITFKRCRRIQIRRTSSQEDHPPRKAICCLIQRFCGCRPAGEGLETWGTRRCPLLCTGLSSSPFQASAGRVDLLSRRRRRRNLLPAVTGEASTARKSTCSWNMSAACSVFPPRGWNHELGDSVIDSVVVMTTLVRLSGQD